MTPPPTCSCGPRAGTQFLQQACSCTYYVTSLTTRRYSSLSSGRQPQVPRDRRDRSGPMGIQVIESLGRTVCYDRYKARCLGNVLGIVRRWNIHWAAKLESQGRQVYHPIAPRVIKENIFVSEEFRDRVSQMCDLVHSRDCLVPAANVFVRGRIIGLIDGNLKLARQSNLEDSLAFLTEPWVMLTSFSELSNICPRLRSGLSSGIGP